MLFRKFICILFIIFSFLKVFAQPINKVPLDSLFNVLDKEGEIMGSMAFAKNGNILYANTLGYSVYNNNEKIHATEKTKYRIGSISKTFTSTIIFQLIEEGKLSLTTPLERFFPDFPNATFITINNLLNHTSGIRNFTKINSKVQPRSHAQMLQFISSRSSNFIPPNTKTSYSNANFLILGYIIEKVCNEPYGDVLKERIASKIGLNDTYYSTEQNNDLNESFPYIFKRDWVQQPETDLSIPGASGGIISTPGDLTKFIQALFSNKLISQNSLDKIKTITDDYGMGMMEFEYHTKKAYGQVGGIDEFESVVAYFPSDSLAIAFCSNGRVKTTKDIVLKVLNTYFDQRYQNPDFKLLSTKTKAKGLLKYTGVYSNAAIPLKIIVSEHNQKLVAQPMGGAVYSLEAMASHKFRCDSPGVIVEFNKEKDGFILTHKNISWNFVKED